MSRRPASVSGEEWVRGEQRRQRLQYGAVAVAALLVVLRLLLESGPALALRVLAVAALAFSVACVVMSVRATSYDMAQAWDARDAWKALPKTDRRTLRRAINRRKPIRADLLDAAEVATRVRAHQMPPMGWLGAGLSTMQLYQELPWAIALGAPALATAIAFTWLRGRWLQQHAAVLAQLPTAPADTH